MFVTIYQTKRHQFPEDGVLQFLLQLLYSNLDVELFTDSVIHVLRMQM
jgi:hypothetical protein